MYQEHAEFHPPADKHVPIWRYMSLAKLISLLDKEALFFARSDLLGDPFEGSYPQIDLEAYATRFRILGLPEKGVEQIVQQRSWSNRNFRRFVCVNCWHMSSSESAAMWGLYSKTQDAVAVRSTYASLVSCFKGYELDIHVGTVSYGDYDRDLLGGSNSLRAFLRKRTSFEHERELRALIMMPPKDVENSSSLEEFWQQETVRDGLYVPIDVTTLIDQIYVYPAAPGWFREACQAVVEKFRLPGLLCVQSRMDKDPLF